ncbi:MAG: MerR family DNA-binding protein [Planktomarina sp.]
MIAQQLGYSIAKIRDALGPLPDERTPTKADWTRLSAEFRVVLDDRINALTRLRDALDGCIGCGCLSLEVCFLYNAEDAAQRYGAGPRYLLGDRSDAAKQ